VDHLTPLKAAGFSRFLIDLTKTRIEKGDLKQIMTALEHGRPLPDTSRFNWKTGFFQKKDDRLNVKKDDQYDKKDDRHNVPTVQQERNSGLHKNKRF
jgi:putative protease